jgi:enoyl-CoA hydratase/carnithine racemase
MSSSGRIEARLEGAVLTIVIDRPEKKNAFTLAMYEEFIAALTRADTDKAVRAVLVTGVGDVFTAGNDLGDFMQNPPTSEDAPVARLLYKLVDTEKPIVGAVNGVAVGIGTTMLLHFDAVYASSSAKFLMPFVNLGIVPEAGSTLLLPMMAGHARAAELLLFGEQFDAQTAKEVGIVCRVLEPAKLFEFAMERAQILAAKPGLALKRTKRLMKDHRRDLVRQTIRDEAELFVRSLSSPEAIEAFTAFFEKRKPDFSKLDAGES